MLARWRDEPSCELIEQGVHVTSMISLERDASGTLLRDGGIPHLHFQPDPRRSAWSVLNLRRKPDLVFCDSAGGEILRIQRRARVPAVFEMVGGKQVTGEIRLRSVLRNSYRIEISDYPGWIFTMPLFSINFRGLSDVGEEVRVQVGPAKTQWNILLQPGSDSIPLRAALAFIHREWWCYA